MQRSEQAAQAAQLAERRAPPSDTRGTRFAGFAANSYDAGTRSVEAVLSAGSAVRRWNFNEELEISADAIDLARVERGLVRLLNAHNQWEIGAILGSVSDCRIENNELIGRLHFADTDAGREAEGMVSRGELRGVSIGYRVTKWVMTEMDDNERETWRAVAWELLEVSLVPVPADPNAGVRSADGPMPGENGNRAAIEEEDEMNRNLPGGAVTPAAPAAVEDQSRQQPAAPAAAAPAAPAAAPTPAISRFTASTALAFVDQARAFGEAVVTRANELVQQNERGEVSVEAANTAILQAAAEAQRAETGGIATGGRAIPAGPRGQGGNEDASRAAIADALVARTLGQQPADASREYMGYRLLEIAAMRAGLSSRERDPITILRAANTSSDFPLLLEAAANKILLARYAAAMPTYQRIAARRDLTDFKQTKLLRTGDFPTLLPYQEDGEIKSGTINEGRETVILGSYGRILRLSRQAIVNDDLGAFDQVFGSIGRMVARFENATFYAMKAVNSGNGPKLSDNVNMFNSAHGNLAASGGAIDVTTIGAGRAAMRKQKGLDNDPLNIPPTTLLVGPDQETLAEQFLAPIQPVEGGKVNPFSGKLDIVTDAAITGNAWELYADPADLPVFHYGYLADAPGPRVLTEEGFNVDGMSFRVTEDFYAGATDYRGGYRNPGA